MKSLSGVQCFKENEYAVFYINEITDDIKSALREELSFICYGKSSSESSYKRYSYKNTLKEFIKRYEGKSPKTQKGMIGELLTHLLFKYYFSDKFDVASPFFNKEERSIKKGFDIVIFEKEANLIYLTEVKSGELHSKKNENETTADLLGTAKRDLISRLNDSENESLWLNAINDAKLVFEQYTDLKDAIVKILDETVEDIESSKANVILTSVLFSSLHNKIDQSSIRTKQAEFASANNFNKVILLALQKNTYIKVYNFLKEESQSE